MMPTQQGKQGLSLGMKEGQPKFDNSGLIPVVVQDAQSLKVLMVAWMNEEALARSLATGMTCFWSRSRRQLWPKGATSGNVQHIREMRLDCDADTLLILVEPAGPACHTGQTSCFHHTLSLEDFEPPLENESETLQ